MNVYQVRDNLKNTIAGKEELLKHVHAKMLFQDVTGDVIANRATHDFLVVNIDELKRILKDVEVCCEQHTEMGWMINPERMGQ
jgi:hypothetical protein